MSGVRLPRSVVVIGPECTGKSTLTRSLAASLGVPYSAEYAREYAASHPSLGAGDVEPIARGQIALEDASRKRAKALGASLVLHDTDLVSTVVYARHYYGACPAWIADAARERLADLYLLCLPDVPWIADGIRDRGDQREHLLAEFRAELDSFGARVVDVGGDWARREAVAVGVLDHEIRGRS